MEQEYELSHDELVSLEYSYFELKLIRKKYINLKETIEEATKQINNFANLLKEQQEYKNKEIIKWVVIRIGPWKLYAFSV